MRLEMDTKDQFRVYVNNLYFPYLNWDDKDEIAKNMRKFILKLNQNYHLSLKGFYRASVYVHKKIGTFIEVEKMDDFDLEIHTIDLRLIIYLNQPFLIGVEDYDLLPKGRKVYFYQNRFYIEPIHLSSFSLISLLEMGNVLYGEEVEHILEEASILSTSKKE